MAGGGDNFTVLRQGSNVQAGDSDSAVVKLYFRTRGMVPVPVLNRITRLNSSKRSRGMHHFAGSVVKNQLRQVFHNVVALRRQ
jgi:hypothetical protein